MNKTNPDIDYGSALKDLLDKLKEAEKIIQSDAPNKYAYGYGMASMGIKMCLVVCTDLTLYDIYKETRVAPPATDQPDDIPPEMFTQTGENAKQID